MRGNASLVWWAWTCAIQKDLNFGQFSADFYRKPLKENFGFTLVKRDLNEREASG